ncbi:type IX secretion system protein PorQ [Algoriphagus namhaensis]
MTSFRLICLLVLIPALTGFGQETQPAFRFLEQSSFTRLSALGGVNVSSSSGPLFFMQNPATMDSLHENSASFHYMNFPGGINWGTAGYQWAPHFKGRLAVGLQLVSYGQFDGFDQLGISTGEFSAQEFQLQASYARSSEVFTYGGSMKFIGSVLDSFQAYALALDLGVLYRHPVEDFRLSFVVKNLGFPISSYLPDQKLSLPSDVRFGASFKPKYMPLRFHWTVRNLSAEEQTLDSPESLGRKAFEKMVWGVEILPSENFSIQVGYNQLIRRQFSGQTGSGTAGFSGGLAFRVKQFEFSYARAFYHLAGASNLFGVSTNFKKKRTF